MKKRGMSLFLAVIAMLVWVCPTMLVQARAISADEMRTKFAELQSKYPTGTYWNGEYMGAWQCMGFALLVDDYLFGECARDWYVHGNVADLCVGDHVRYQSTAYYDHSIVVTNI